MHQFSQVHPVSRITGEGMADKNISRWGLCLNKRKGVGRRGSLITVNPSRDKSDGFGKNAPVFHVYPAFRTTSKERAKCLKTSGWERGIGTALGRDDVGPCYTRGSEPRR